jgi:hypothetical protein
MIPLKFCGQDTSLVVVSAKQVGGSCVQELDTVTHSPDTGDPYGSGQELVFDC